MLKYWALQKTFIFHKFMLKYWALQKTCLSYENFKVLLNKFLIPYLQITTILKRK
jgi:hypothetical protein